MPSATEPSWASAPKGAGVEVTFGVQLAPAMAEKVTTKAGLRRSRIGRWEAYAARVRKRNRTSRELY